jgi:phosphohistidine phosphatase SixA
VLENHPGDATVAIVGHEPTVSMLVAQLIGESSAEAVAFEPGTAALLDVEVLAPRGARLVWLLTMAAAGDP